MTYDDNTPPGGLSASELLHRDTAGRAKSRHDQDEKGRSPSPEGIVRSDSFNFRRAFAVAPDDLVDLGIASNAGLIAVNEYWQKLGDKMGFVWTTVSDLRHDPVSDSYTFTAEVEGEVPPSPAFEEWWRANRLKLPGARHEIAREAWDAGARAAATTLARLDDGIVEIVREIEVPSKDSDFPFPLVLGGLYGIVVGAGGLFAVLSIGGWL